MIPTNISLLIKKLSMKKVLKKESWMSESQNDNKNTLMNK